ncbi:hypothetical protein L6452_15060 [Arctium lappa]|uniref:Uncharacterized protein n=1 Tax=Arctium lappa TaxID=4217 RepID=A0ACB9CMJ9_ARCLA|nr:hypothetical protein L6452_15060 [Arctium lappa]
MEDPESEWAIQEHDPCWKLEEAGDEASMLKWILNKGYGIGKKMVITGIIVSSAPLVLPPLVVFSAMGVAFSVPFGFVFATYACTNKLMTKLLPTPESPLLDQEKKEQQLEDIKQGVNMRGIVDKKGYYYTDEDDDHNLMQKENEEERIRFKLDDDGYGKKVVEYERIMDRKRGVELDDDDYRQFLQERNILIEDEEKEQMEDIVQQGVEMRLGLNVAGDARIQGSGSNRNFVAGSVDEQGYEEDDGEYLEGDDDSLEEEKKEAMEDEETEEIVKGSTGLLEKIRDEGRTNIGNDSTTEPVMVKEIDSAVEEGSKNGGEIRLVGDTTKKRNMGSQEKNSSNIESAISKKKKEQLIQANADAREIGDESGLDLFDDRNTSMILESLEAGDKTKESAANDNLDVMALPSFKRPLLDSNYVKVASTTDTKVPSREDKLDEEKMWEKIGAMRAIVGYKAPSEATYIGELKALYAFTGVEPPASLKGDSDLDEVNANLKFLMSIVGVK